MLRDDAYLLAKENTSWTFSAPCAPVKYLLVLVMYQKNPKLYANKLKSEERYNVKMVV